VAKKSGASLVRLAVRTMMTTGTKPASVIKVLRPPELAYLCDICDELRSLRLCDDVFFEDEEAEDDA
jgi:hypothetical protein